MKRLHYTAPNDLSLLHDQLLAAIPSLRPTATKEGELTAVIRVEGLGANIWLTVPNDADNAAIQAVVEAHNPANRLSGLAIVPYRGAIGCWAVQLDRLATERTYRAAGCGLDSSPIALRKQILHHCAARFRHRRWPARARPL